MRQSTVLPMLAGSNAVCAAISLAIVYFAFRDWPARYAAHALSFSVVLFFLFFVAVSVVGSIATGLYVRQRKGEVLLRLASGPAILLATGFGLGLLKMSLTGDF
jgi:hypothetical protein